MLSYFHGTKVERGRVNFQGIWRWEKESLWGSGLGIPLVDRKLRNHG